MCVHTHAYVLTCMCSYMCLVPLGRPEDGVGCPGTKVLDNCELLCECWEPNPGLQEHQVLSTAEPSLQLPANSAYAHF